MPSSQIKLVIQADLKPRGIPLAHGSANREHAIPDLPRQREPSAR